MFLNVHSQYSLRYGTMSIKSLIAEARAKHIHQLVLTDINNSTGCMEFIRLCRKEGEDQEDNEGNIRPAYPIKPIVGIEFRRNQKLLYIGIAKNKEGMKELNDFLTHHNLNEIPLPDEPFAFLNAFVVYPYGNQSKLRDNEYLGESFLVKLRLKQDFINSFKTTALNKYKEKELELEEFDFKVSDNVSDLEIQKKQKIHVFASTTNEIIRAELEKEINELHSQIKLAQSERHSIKVGEYDIYTFAQHAQELMEHPEEMLIKQDNSNILVSLFELVFDELPTYQEIVNGTPKLSLFYNVSEAFMKDKSSIVRDSSLNWNTIQEIILEWNKVFKEIEMKNFLADDS